MGTVCRTTGHRDEVCGIQQLVGKDETHRRRLQGMERGEQPQEAPKGTPRAQGDRRQCQRRL